MSLQRHDIEAIIPHKGGMCLWDEVLAWDAQRIQLRSRGHTRKEHPLRAHGRLRAVHLCEYGAQAMAVHGGLQAREQGREAPPGLLVALRDVQLHVAHIDDLFDAIECNAEALAISETSQQYQFRIMHAGHLLAEGRAVVMLHV